MTFLCLDQDLQLLLDLSKVVVCMSFVDVQTAYISYIVVILILTLDNQESSAF
jgi:hypothetical protein